MSRTQVTKKNVLSAIGRLSGLDKQNADTWDAVRKSLEDIADRDFTNGIDQKVSELSAQGSKEGSSEKDKEIARAANTILIVVSGFQTLDKSVDKSLKELIQNNHSIGNFELKIDEATTHGRITNQLKKSGVDVDSTQSFGTDDIIKIKEFFQENGKEILGLFAAVKITPEALHNHIKKHLTAAFAAFQKIEGGSISSEAVKGLIETLANAGEAAKAAVGLGNDFSTKEAKEELLKKIKEKLPDTSDDILVTAAAAAFNTTEQVVRFERAQKAEAEKIIAAAKARAAGKMGSILTEGARTYSPKSEEDVETLITKNRAAAKESLKQGNLGDAVKNFELARNARNGVVLEYKTVDGVEILISGDENRRRKPEGIENLELEYLTLVMAAIDIAEVEGKTSLKASLLERATGFLEEFLEKAESLDVIAAAFPKKEAIGVQKSLSKMLDEEIKNHLVKSLRDAGISNASDKLIVAHDFQSLANHYPHIVSIDGRGAIKHEPYRATLLSASGKGNLDRIFTADKKPIAFSNLPWWHQDLMQKYAPAILASTAPLPPASVVSVLGIKNVRPVGQTQRLQMSKPPHPFLAKIASLPWVQKTFPEFAEKINERTKQWQTDDDTKHSDRREKEGDFSDAYSAAKKEITSSKRTMDAAGSAPGVPTVTEVIAETSVSPPASVASVSGLTEKEADLLEKQAKETRKKMYTDAGFSEEEIDEFENDLFPPPEKDAPAVPAEHVATHSSAVASEIVGELGEVEKSLKAAKDDVSTPTVETPHHGTEPEPRTSSALSGAEPNEARDTASSPVIDADNAREEAAILLAKLGNDALNAIKGAMDTTHGIAEVTSDAVVNHVEKLEAKIAARETSDEHGSSNREH